MNKLKTKNNMKTHHKHASKKTTMNTRNNLKK